MMARDAHALVITSILGLKRKSPESHAAHRDYQETRLLRVMPKLQRQKSLLEKSIATGVDHDAAVSKLDAEIVTEWLALDSRVNDAWIQLHPEATEEVQEVAF